MVRGGSRRIVAKSLEKKKKKFRIFSEVIKISKIDFGDIYTYL